LYACTKTLPYINLNLLLTGGFDYASGPHNVPITKGEKCKFFTIPIFDNNVYEGEKKFEVSLQPSRLPHGIVPCTPSEVEITILDDECK